MYLHVQHISVNLRHFHTLLITFQILYSIETSPLSLRCTPLFILSDSSFGVFFTFL